MPIFVLPKLLSKRLLIFLSSFWTSDEIPGWIFFRGWTCYNANCTQAGNPSSYNCTLGSHNIQVRVAKMLFVCRIINAQMNYPLSMAMHLYIFSKASNLLNSLQATLHGRALQFIIFIIISCVMVPFTMFLFSITGLFVCVLFFFVLLAFLNLWALF